MHSSRIARRMHVENKTPDKMLEQAQTFYLVFYLFVTSKGQSSNFLTDDINLIISQSKSFKQSSIF